MPLVSATNDDDFIVEVTNVTAEAEDRQRRHTAAMIEEYLRRRIQAAEQAAQAAATEEIEKVRREKADLESAHTATLAGLAKTNQRMNGAAAALAQGHQTNEYRRAYGIWQAFVERRRGQRGQAMVLEREQMLRLAYHAYIQWRLLTSARRVHKADKTKEAAVVRTQNELQRMVEQLHDRLREEEKRNENLEEQLKSAFLKGVSALNREAVQVLRGEGSGRDVEDIEAILSGSRHSSGVSPLSQNGAHAQQQLQQQQQGLQEVGAGDASVPDRVCPVHYRDGRGTYYHPCYAPCSCPYYPGPATDREAGSVSHRRGCTLRGQGATEPVSGVGAAANASVDSSHSSQHTPFVVHADPSSVQSFDTGYPRRQGQKPRWR